MKDELQAARPILVDGDVALVTLTKGYTAVIDIADAALVEGVNWCAAVTPYTTYVKRCVRLGGRNVTVILHRILINPPQGMEVDHIDGDGLNNRRSNLRLTTHSENCRNRRRRSDNKSGFKGVCWNNSRRKWQAQVHAGGKTNHLGYFTSAEAAHVVYCEAAARLHGEFARMS